MARPFLTARWLNLCIFSFQVDGELLAPHFPRGLSLDEFSGSPVASLVAFQFHDTRVKGVRWPGHVNFPEWNLRFYVRRAMADGSVRRGVVFVREFVPRLAISLVAHWVYNEPYVTAAMRDDVGFDHDAGLHAHYTLRYAGREHSMRVAAGAVPVNPGTHSTEHFFKEHQWGYGADRRGNLLEYEVRHPVWAVRPVRRYELDIDWSALYGTQWGIMQGREPISVVFAVGSEVEVLPKGSAVTPSAP